MTITRSVDWQWRRYRTSRFGVLSIERHTRRAYIAMSWGHVAVEVTRAGAAEGLRLWRKMSKTNETVA